VRRNLIRRSFQAVFLALFFYSADIFFKTDPLIVFLTSISARIIVPGIALSCIMIILTPILGRFFCGWGCPLGATFDLIRSLNRKKVAANNPAEKKFYRIKFFILAIIFFLALLGIQAVWLFDPIAIMARSVALIPVSKTDVYYLSHSAVIFTLFLSICIPAFFAGRFWCRVLCPLGALYNLAARSSRFIRPDIKNDVAVKKNGGDGISRRDFIFLLFSSVFLTGFRNRRRASAAARRVIRPPAALEEGDFTDRCIRCGSCMKICITNGLQPVMLEAGLEGVWTPQLVPEVGYCDYNCALCGGACPTGAIRRLPLKEKQNARLGTADVDHSICLAWSLNQRCLICERSCPVPGNAVKVRTDMVEGIAVGRPVVDKALCTGCGGCQNKCPVRPVRAIRVSPS